MQALPPRRDRREEEIEIQKGKHPADGGRNALKWPAE